MFSFLDLFSVVDFLCFAMIGAQELIIILFLLAIPIVLIGVTLLVVFVAKGSRQNPAPPLQKQLTTETRLRDLDALLEAGKITESEHAEQRKGILTVTVQVRREE